MEHRIKRLAIIVSLFGLWTVRDVTAQPTVKTRGREFFIGFAQNNDSESNSSDSAAFALLFMTHEIAHVHIDVMNPSFSQDFTVNSNDSRTIALPGTSESARTVMVSAVETPE